MMVTAAAGAPTEAALVPFEIGSEHPLSPPLDAVDHLDRARRSVAPLVDAAGVADILATFADAPPRRLGSAAVGAYSINRYAIRGGKRLCAAWRWRFLVGFVRFVVAAKIRRRNAGQTLRAGPGLRNGLGRA